MTASLAANRLRLSLATWAQETTDPSQSSNPANLGSFWMRNGNYPSRPTELYLKLSSDSHGWTLQNLLNLNIFNVLDYGAVGDGVTDCTLAIQAAINACAAAGGGGVYFPATPNFYAIQRQTNTFLITITQANITLFGDGYASKIKQVGSAAGGATFMFRVTNGCTRLRIWNLYFDNYLITNPSPTEQNHGIVLQGQNIAGNAPTDIETIGCYFGDFIGDGYRVGNGEIGKEIDGVKVHYCAFDLRTNTQRGGRSCISFQRYTHRCQIQFCWFKGSHDQQIDSEPTAGIGPTDFIILGNHLNHENQAVNCITATGASTIAFNANRNILACNTVTDGGDITCGRMSNCEVRGNIMIQTAAEAGLPCVYMVEGAQQNIVDGNVLVKKQSLAGNPSAVIKTLDQNGGVPIRTIITDNICESNPTTAADGGIVTVGCPDALVDGNVVVINSAIAGVGGIVMQSSSDSASPRLQMAGNMLFSIGVNNLTDALQFGAAGEDALDTSAIYNYFSGGISVGVKWAVTAAESFGLWRGCSCNNGPGLTSQMYGVSGVGTQDVTMEGMIGPDVQACGITNAAAQIDTTGKAAAPPGSFLVNNGAGPAVLSLKETGTGVDGGTSGWTLYGATDLVMGAASVGAATAARYLAPGGLDLAQASSVEIQWAVPRAGKIRNLRGAFVAGTGGGNNTYTMRKNGADQVVTFTVANTATSGSDITHSFTVAAGDLISISVTKSLAPGTPQTDAELTFEFV